LSFHDTREIIMMNRFYVFATALTGCAVAAAAYGMRRHRQRQAALQQKDDLRTWEGEGGSTAHPVAISAKTP
jgi:hypothetical protein